MTHNIIITTEDTKEVNITIWDSHSDRPIRISATKGSKPSLIALYAHLNDILGVGSDTGGQYEEKDCLYLGHHEANGGEDRVL